ncbi:TIGR04222 domain-containing membrane protein [Streptomyces sp. NBC_01317]|uniref:TIGR04222 domain-containing membrane protein n=1 Tax=Streptomyces sp. NBC_01317 TaxID=2903822 RepID=UPI002E0EEDF6|nr:TIGR04222 domain-containing membrane protein [Streptomyces sp. NBC_01317]
MAALFRRRVRPAVPAAVPELDPYDIAHLAGGPRRVAETALTGLRDRGLVRVLGSRVRAVPYDAGAPAGPAGHPVEEALIALCPRGRGLAAVLVGVANDPVTERIGDRLVSYGLLTRRYGLTRAGRRHLESARREGTLPAYVFEGPAALPDARFRATVTAATLPSGLGRTLLRMAKALDRDADSHGHGDSDGGHSCGGGGGGDY